MAYPDKPPNKKLIDLGIVLRRVDAPWLEVTTTAGVLDCAIVATTRLQIAAGASALEFYSIAINQLRDITSLPWLLPWNSAAPLL